MKFRTLAPLAVSLLILAACGGGGAGGSGTSPATLLAYQDPAPTGYRLMKSGASTGTRLVLDLYGPAGASAKGIAFFLSADTAKVAWIHPSGSAGSCIQPGTVFPLGSAPQLVKDKAQGGLIQVGLFQKGGAATVLGTAPILSVALDLKGGAAKGAVALEGNQALVLNADGTSTGIAIQVGALSAQ